MEWERGMTMHVMLVFDAVIAAFGLYLVWAAWNMKRTKEVCPLLFGAEEKSCKDKEGCIEGIYRQMLLFGLLAALYGGLGLFNGVLHAFGKTFDVICALAFLLACFWFFAQIRKSRDRYF